MKVSCFGDTFSHTHAAAVSLLEDEDVADYELIGCDSVYETLRKVRDGESDYAVVPIENSYEGTVAASTDAIGELRLYIVRETVLKVKQSLIVQKGVSLSSVKKVYSHPQALAQCRNALRNALPDAKTVSVAFTSAGLDMLDDNSAAIARAPKSNQEVLIDDLSDSPDNCTRFVLVRSSPQKKGNKVSVLFSTGNRPGALLDVLEVIKAQGLNMTKIESRPAKKRMGQYVFYVDFLFCGTDAEMGELFVKLSDKSEELQFLGRYDECAAI